MDTLWQWLNTNAGVLSLLATALATVLPISIAAILQLRVRREELREKRRQSYHETIARLVAPAPGEHTMHLDRQIAAVFELRSFPEYYELSGRVLRGLQGSWAGSQQITARLLDEIAITLEFLDSQQVSRRSLLGGA